MILARGRHGIKPLYFGKQDHFVVFASEPPVVAGMLGQISPNHQKVYEYLTMGLYDLDEQTFFDQVFALNPGHVAKVGFERGEISFALRRWSEVIPPEPIEIDFEHAVSSVRDLLLQSIELHLRSDVPVAVALSGGVDSSGIVGAVRHLYPNREIHTFSYSNPGFAKDESEWANLDSEAPATA
jgi:asparagine synthase (glutamine-hydrolysing)